MMRKGGTPHTNFCRVATRALLRAPEPSNPLTPVDLHLMNFKVERGERGQLTVISQVAQFLYERTASRILPEIALPHNIDVYI